METTKNLNLYSEESPIRVNPKVGPIIDWHGRHHDLRDLEPKWAQRMADDPAMLDVEHVKKDTKAAAKSEKDAGATEKKEAEATEKKDDEAGEDPTKSSGKKR